MVKMEDILKRIKAGEVLVADGAIGTMLIGKGFNSGECLESINLSQPEIIEDIARRYLKAGAEIIQTNTFGASPLKLSLYSLDDRIDEINRSAVRAVKQAVGDDACISGSCGPSGRILRPFGDADPDDVFRSFKMQMAALVKGGVDLVCIETMTDINEAILAVKAARSVSQSIPVMATMTFDSTPRGFHTIMGVSTETAAIELEKAGADIIGSNCGNGIEKMIEIARDFKKYTSLPLIIQSNAGLPEMKGDRLIYRETPEFMAEKARELVSAGVSIIGGCCGTTPEHIAAIRKMVDSLPRQQSPNDLG